MKEDTQYIHKRDSKGRLLPGQPGLPGAGRPYGSISMQTKVKQEIERMGLDVVNSMYKSALEGDTAAGKAILDRILPVLKAVEVSGLDVTKLPKMIIDAEIVQPDNDDNP